MSNPKEITIVGAGLVGSLLSVLLGQRGYKVNVYEKRGDMRRKDVDSGRSINLALAERGIHALKKAGLMDEVQPLLIPMKGRVLHDRAGELDFLAYGQRPEEVIYSVSRGELNKILMESADQHENVTLHFNHELQSIDFKNQKIEMVDNADGQSNDLSYEILIGADGAGSRVRRALLPVVDGTDNSELLDHDYKELTIPAGPGGQHQIEREALHIWPRGGFMLIALPNVDGSFTVTLFLQKQGKPSFESLQDKSALDEFFQTEFPDALKLIPDLATEYYENPQGVLGTVRCEPWNYEDSVLLIGDASHAIVPFHGQGMNAGFEDAALVIDELEKFGGKWDAMIPCFGALRKLDADAIADMALENYITMRDSVRDPNFALKKELGFSLEKELPNLFIPRYSQVMFHRVPYAQAQSRGIVQQGILKMLVDGKENILEIDMSEACALARKGLIAFDESCLAN